MRNSNYSNYYYYIIVFNFLVVMLMDGVVGKNMNYQIVDVGVVIESSKKIELSCINMSVADFYENHSHFKTRLNLHFRHPNHDVVGAAAAALDLIKNVEVKAIIGPSTSMQANFVINLGQRAQVPIISYSASNPSLVSTRNPYFFRATRSDSAQVRAISAIIERFGWKEAVPIYVENEYGVGIIPSLIDALQAVGARVPCRSPISPLATDDEILEELGKLKTIETRVFIVHMDPSLGSRLFIMATEIGMMSEGYVWIITDRMTHFVSSSDSVVLDSMQGVLGVKPYIPRTKRMKKFQAEWKQKFRHTDMVNAKLTTRGLWAYDVIVALAKAFEKAAEISTNFGFNKPNASANVISTDLETFGVSQIGPFVHQTLSNTRFEGLTGDFSFINRQLQSSSGVQIVNLNAEEGRRIGFWAPETGFVKRFNSSASNNRLSPIIWPGDTVSIPKGWSIPTNGKKLRILVPVKEGFTQFVNVTRDPNTNTTTIQGYCIDLFDAAVQQLPYAVTYEYIPFANSDGKMAGSYNDMVEKVHLKKYDAAVGDIVIVANRSLHVDFTLPYMESSRVTMIVPITNGDSMKAWMFLKPLTLDLWLTSLCFFFFIGFVVWVLEHRINEDFQGSPAQQVGTSFWFSFSTLVFAHREKVVSNLSRTVVIIWCFVGLILTQSYTASLSSFLTIDKLKPTVTSIDELIKKGDSIGYQKGSFVLGTLRSLGFDESKLIPYKSAEECDELLSKGSRTGGIAAAFGDPTSVHLILAQNCSKYTLVEPTSNSQASRWKNKSNIQEFITDGLGFVFPKASPLAPDISRAILNITQGDKIKEIEGKWFGIKDTCPDKSNSDESNRLGLNSFWGLFLIAGIASFLALTIYFGMFVYKHKGVLVSSDSGVSLPSRIVDLLKICNRNDHISHNLDRNVLNDEAVPSAYSLETEFICEQGTNSAEFVGSNSKGSMESMFIEVVDPDDETPITPEITWFCS